MDFKEGHVMAFDEGLAQLFRDDLARKRSITEKKMFGGLCFMHRGHILCGVHKSKNGKTNMGMFRVGPDQYETALEIDGVGELAFTGRPMKGLVECDEELVWDDERRRQMIKMALKFTTSLPEK